MKKILRTFLVVAIAMGASLSAEAQYYYLTGNGNPGNLNMDSEFPVGAGLPPGWTTLFTGPANTPVWTNPVSLPFAFSFNGTPVTDYKVATSGVLTFTSGATAVPPAANTVLPSPNIPDNSILIWGMYANTGDYIVTKTFGVAPNRQHWIQFNSYSKPGSNLWTYWSIMLEETTNKIYIVDQRSSSKVIGLTAGIQIDASTAFMVAGSPSLDSRSTGDASAVDNRYYEFIYGTQPARDMLVTLVNIPPKLALSRAPFTIEGTVKSHGAAPVTSFDLNYKIGNNPTVTTAISNVNLISNDHYKFSHPTTWNPTSLGSYDLKVWASNINGGTDLVPSNDTAQVSVIVEDAPRTVLHEVFTSSTCGPCLTGNAKIHAIAKANPGMSIDIKYQQNFPAPGDDPYQTTEAINRRGFYGVNSIPHVKPDGGTNFTSSWNFNANNYTPQLLNQYAGVSTNVLVDGVYYINPVDSTVTATATITPFANVNSTNLVLHSVITEKYTTGNVRTNGETEFFDVMKKMMPNENGLPISPLVNGQPVNYTNSFAMTKANYNIPFTRIAARPNRVENLDSLRVVFFVQDRVTKAIYNAVIGTRVSQPLGTSKALDAYSMNLYPNPTNGYNINLDVNLETAETVQIKVVNTLGQVIYTADKGKMAAGRNTLALNLAGQAKGIYFVNVTVGGKTVTKKLSLTL